MIELDQSVKSFLKANKELILNMNFNDLYYKASINEDLLMGSTWQLAQVFYDAGCDPLADGVGRGLLTVVPRNYIAFSDVVPKPLPKHILVIERGAFAATGGFSEMILPEGLTTIGPSAFSHSNLMEIVIPASVKKIDSNAFKGCPFLYKVVIEGAPEVDSTAFINCPQLKVIWLKEASYKKIQISGVRCQHL